MLKNLKNTTNLSRNSWGKEVNNWLKTLLILTISFKAIPLRPP